MILIDRLRLFVAVPTPDSWRPLLQEECVRLKTAAPGFGRWTPEAGWHVTLAFLGNQPSTIVPAISEALEAATAPQSPFALRLSHIGSFRHGRRVQVVWAGIADDPPGSLTKLQATVEESLATAGVEFERARGPLQGHLTLARARRDATIRDCELVTAAIEHGSNWAPETHADCSQVLLFKSDLRPTGAVYTFLHSARLGISSNLQRA